MVSIAEAEAKRMAAMFQLAGWEVSCFGAGAPEARDITNEDVLNQAIKECAEADFVWITLPRGDRDDLRSSSRPLGVPGLQGADREMVRLHNEMAEIGVQAAEAARASGASSAREAPNRSRHWRTPLELDQGWSSLLPAIR